MFDMIVKHESLSSEDEFTSSESPTKKDKPSARKPGFYLSFNKFIVENKKDTSGYQESNLNGPKYNKKKEIEARPVPKTTGCFVG